MSSRFAIVEPARSSTAFPDPKRIRVFVLACALNLLVIWLLNATLVPGINESHYLPKAKHAWDPSFAPGDLFLSSGNAHWLFAQIAGSLSTLMPLSAVAWVGRIVSWCLMAIAWQRFALTFGWTSSLSAVVLAGWLVATKLGNWAGEWAVGGFEAKALAYPFVIFALAEVLRGHWNRVWILSGAAVAFHPLVGGWAGVTFAAAWLWFGRHESPFVRQLIPGLVAGVLSAIGVVPALAMIGGPSRSGDIVVAQIHAFYRLAHHQSPRLFSAAQHWSGAITLGLLIVATVLVLRLRHTPLRDAQMFALTERDGLTRRLLAVAWLSIGVSLCGLAIDLLGVGTRPDVAASLLRFYWFRWSDIAVPLAWMSAMWMLATQPRSGPMAAQAVVSQARSRHGDAALPPVWLLRSMLALATFVCVGIQVSKNWQSEIAPADRTLLMSGSSELASGPEVVAHWQAVCAWVKENTPNDALFLTPRAQQTFKWYAGRAEVVSYKDVPQDSGSLLEWYDRIGRCAPPRDADGRPLGWTTAQLKRLRARYGFEYVIVDRRIQREPPLLELVYPQVIREATTYAVFKMAQTP